MFALAINTIVSVLNWLIDIIYIPERVVQFKCQYAAPCHFSYIIRDFYFHLLLCSLNI